MKVILVQPPIEDFYNTKIRTYPLQLLYLGTKIKDICDVSIVDLRTNFKSTIISKHPFPELHNFYREGIRTPFAMFNKYYRFGAGKELIKKIIIDNQPDMVAISSLFTTYSAEAREVAVIAKEISRDIITVIGGTHPTIFPDFELNNHDIDYVIRGEGETPLFSLIQHLKKGMIDEIDKIPGICFRGRGDVNHISEINIENNIDLIPCRSLIESGNYRIGRKSYTFFMTSRGCPFHCAFCGKPPVPYRRRSLASIESEIEDCLNLKIQAIDFEDDMLTYDTNFFNNILDVLKGKDMVMSAMNGIYAETLNKETLHKMYDAGFRRLNFSLVDISRTVTRTQRRHLPGNFLQLLPFLENSFFLIEIHFIIGLPEQRPEDVMETLIFLMSKRLLPGPSIFYPAPGSPLFSKKLNNDSAKQFKYMRSSSMTEINPLFPRDVIYTLIKLTRFINFVKHCLDNNPSLERLSDIPALLVNENEQFDRHIITTLLQKKRFECFDLKEETFIEEAQNLNVIEEFFKKAGNSTIRGFKTMNSLVIDL